MAARSSHKFQAPKGTRDFYPADMAVRRYIESVWREVSINHGFEEIDGPTFEHLELYTAKSGPGIVSELFSFRREGGDVDYALRPEFTPTLARMYAARAAQLPKPVKWFVIESNFRAERPQRGRLREFFQWNADIIGDDSPKADAEVIAVTIGILDRLGLTPDDVQIKVNDRGAAAAFLLDHGVPETNVIPVLELIDKAARLPLNERRQRQEELGVSDFILGAFGPDIIDISFGRFDEEYARAPKELQAALDASRPFHDPIRMELEAHGIGDWCRYSTSIVRGLAYYTGTVFEVIAEGERAIAGGGRYDNLVELFGGPQTPAVGIAMGDVVLRLMLEDRGLLKPEELMPRPDVFVIDATEGEPARFSKLIAELRRAGLHARHSYRATRNVGKLLGEAGKARARFAVILGRELESGNVVLKDLDAGEQRNVPLDDLVDELLRGRAAHQ
jgi:histidyl-tRNA synthetase